MIIIMLLVFIFESQLCQSKIFEIKEKNFELIMETMNGFEFKIFRCMEDEISQLNQIQSSKCTQNCKDCTRHQCYLGNTELDHSEIKMYDLDTQLMVLQPLTYFNDQNQSHSIARVSLANPGQYINSFVDDGFQLCYSKTDKTLETQFQMNLKDIPQQQVLLLPILSNSTFKYVQMNYLKLGDTVIDISSCLIYFNLGDKILKFQFPDPLMDLTEDSKELISLFENSDFNHFPDWLFRSLYLDFEKAGFRYDDNSNELKIVYRNLNDSTNVKLGSEYDFKFYNKENEEYPIIYSSNQYLQELKNKKQWIRIAITNKANTIILGTSFFENKKVQFNFKENFITIQNYFDDRCFQYEKSTLYQQEILALWVSIPLIILLTLFFIKYQNNEESYKFQGENPNEI